MHNYLDLLNNVLESGHLYSTRSGRCLEIFDARLEFNLKNDLFPIVTTKEINYKAVVDELLWFLSGSTNINDLKSTKIWNEWANENGDLGPIYGHQWRNLAVDQISSLVTELKTNPKSRRLLVNSWNVSQLHLMKLPPCHYAFECYVSNGYLDLKWHQRSVDMMLGLPFNISSYATLLHILALECGLLPGRLIADLGNCHIYLNHIEQVEEQLTRIPKELPELRVNKKPIFEYEVEDFQLVGYNPHPHIKCKVAV